MFSRLEGGLDSAFDKAAGAVFRAPLEPAQIAKRAEKQMNREKLVGAGTQYAPTLYTVLVGTGDDRKLFGFYPTMAAEIETYLVGKGTENGLKFDGRPLVRFIVDENLKSGKFDVIAENVAAPIVAQLRDEEMEFWGLKEPTGQDRGKDKADDAGLDRLGAAAGAGPGIAGASVVLPALDALPQVEPLVPLQAEPLPMVAASGAARLATADDDPYGAAADSASPRPVSEALRGPALGGTARLANLNAGKSYALTDTSMVLGRDASCDITVDDVNISRRHVRFTQDALGSWKLTDLDSTNGTRLNGSPVASALLRDGDQIALGVTVLEFRVSVGAHARVPGGRA
ncbi:MAG: DUF3662 and FHA domain-containing protein [Coriobacteriales bacterium]|jgi:hypothetical protein|nr:DUF3662 and FHA domain-containing protein [Coriobacteriales bacterium]